MRLLIAIALAACSDPILAPTIEGHWWDIAGNPDLGPLTGAGQQPVDFAIWQASDGTWQLWSCIRGTLVGGNTRLFYRWQSLSLDAPDWTPIGIAMTADPSVGEAEGGLQAPYVLREGTQYRMFYGAWQSICSATSSDGITFTRVLDANGQCPLFSEGDGANTRDPMVVRAGDHWEIVYTAFTPEGGKVFARTSADLVHWSDSHVIAYAGVAGVHGSSGESPFLVHHTDPDVYTLFRTHAYGVDALTEVYQSADPLDFGTDGDRYHIATLPVASPEVVDNGDAQYIAAFKPNTDGFRIARLVWKRN